MRAKIEQLKKKGQGLVEYALILVFIAIVVIVILTFLGNQVRQHILEDQLRPQQITKSFSE